MSEFSIIQNVIQLGIAGLIIYVILRPIIIWFMRRADEKDSQIREMLERHFKHDEERHQVMIAMLDSLPNKITESIVTVYNPETYQMGGKAYEKILNSTD